MIMKIFELLEDPDPVQYQMLNRRFYNGICPHWFRQILWEQLLIRLTETEGVIKLDLTASNTQLRNTFKV